MKPIVAPLAIPFLMPLFAASRKCFSYLAYQNVKNKEMISIQTVALLVLVHYRQKQCESNWQLLRPLLQLFHMLSIQLLSYGRQSRYMIYMSELHTNCPFSNLNADLQSIQFRSCPSILIIFAYAIRTYYLSKFYDSFDSQA